MKTMLLATRAQSSRDRQQQAFRRAWINAASMALLLLAVSAIASAQTSTDVGPDAVESYTPGTGSGAGYGLEFYPANVLGLPDSTARTHSATIDPKQVLGLGLGGEIILRFDRRVIVDGEGPDFTIFENPFTHRLGGRDRVYAEPGAVAVSRDGAHYIEYPFDSLTLEGCAGVTPTNGLADPTDPTISGGDSFDLAMLGIDSVRYIRIRDVTSIVKSNRDHPFWDMTLNGFDLDAVVALHQAETMPSTVAEAGNHAGSRAMVYPNPILSTATVRIALDHAATIRARLLDPLGREEMLVADRHFPTGEHHLRLDATALPSGLYLMVIEIDGGPMQALKVSVAH